MRKNYRIFLKTTTTIFTCIIMLIGCKREDTVIQKEENLLSNLPKEQTHVDSIKTNVPLALSYLTETYSVQATSPIDQEIIPIKTTNYLKAIDTLFADIEIPDTIKNVKPKTIRLNPFISYATHPSPEQAKELRSSPLANTDIQYLNAEQGLPNTNIHDIDEDQNGFLWLSHSNGLTRYDGYHFYNYTTKNGLPINFINSLTIDKKGHFWILSPQNLVFYDGLKFKTYNNKSGLLNDPIIDILIDENNNLWILHKNEGVGKIVNDTIYYYDKTNGLKQPELNAIGIDSLNRIFVSYTNELPSLIHKNTILNYRLNREAKKQYWYKMFTAFAYRDNKGFLWTSNYGGDMLKTSPNSRSQVFKMPTSIYYDITTCMTHDKQNNYWFGTNDAGVICKKDTSYTTFTINNGLTSNKINSIVCDKQNNIWIATATSGLVRIKQNGFKIFGNKEGFTNKLITSLNKDSKDNLIIGTVVDGLWIFNGNTFYKPKCIANQIIINAIEDDKNRVLAYDGNGFNYELFRSNDKLQVYDQLKCVFDYPTLSYILAAHKDRENKLWLFKPTKGLCLRNNDTLKVYSTKTGLAAGNIRSISSDSKGNIWLANAGCGISKINNNTITHYTKKEGLLSNNSYIVYCDGNDNVWVGSSLGISLFNGTNFTSIETTDGLTSNIIMSIVEDVNKNIWIGTTNGLNQLIPNPKSPKGFTIIKYYKQDGLKSVSFNRNAAVRKGDEIYWGTSEGLLSLNVKNSQNQVIVPKVIISDIDIMEHTINYSAILDSIKQSKPYIQEDTELDLTKIRFDSLINFFNYPKHLSLPYYINTITFRFAAQNVNIPHKLNYRYFLRGYDSNWNLESSNNYAKYSNLPAGNYTIEIQSKVENSEWSSSTYYSFKINSPFWETWWFRLISISFVIFIIWLIFKWRNKQLIERQITLEQTVAERTKEINNQKHVIEEKQKEILDSINYAKRIQYTLLAHDEFLKENLHDHFTYFNPKDIVSGDFYWAAKKENKFYLAVCDSTGHGVPGAFMSLLNIGFLSEAINEKGIVKPNEVFNFVRQRLIDNISKEGQQDGFDGILVCFEQNVALKGVEGLSTKITYAAANNNPVLIQNNELVELEADRMPVGIGERTAEFKLYSINARPGDTLYLYTDGYADQFGGPKGKKFKYKQLNELLSKINSQPFMEQSHELKNVFENWRGNLEQVDDVCVIGIKI